MVKVKGIKLKLKGSSAAGNGGGRVVVSPESDLSP